MDRGQYYEGRRILHDLEQFAPKSSSTRAVRQRFIDRAAALVKQAGSLTGAERLDALTEALRIWPTLEGLPDQYAEAFAAVPTLDVGVVDLPRPFGPFVRSPAAARATRLVYLPILAEDSEAAALGQVPGQLTARLEVSDLGRRLDLTIRDDLTWSDGTRGVSALDVVRSITDRTDPNTPGFHARWASLLERVEPNGSDRVSIFLNRSPLKPEAWLLGPVGPAHAGPDGRVPVPGGEPQPVGDGPYRVESQSEDRLVFRVAPGEAAKIVRVREIPLPGAEAALKALQRGEISLLEHVPPSAVTALSGEPEIRVGRSVRPSLARPGDRRTHPGPPQPHAPPGVVLRDRPQGIAGTDAAPARDRRGEPSAGRTVRGR